MPRFLHCVAVYTASKDYSDVESVNAKLAVVTGDRSFLGAGLGGGLDFFEVLGRSFPAGAFK